MFLNFLLTAAQTQLTADDVRSPAQGPLYFNDCLRWTLLPSLVFAFMELKIPAGEGLQLSGMAKTTECVHSI